MNITREKVRFRVCGGGYGEWRDAPMDYRDVVHLIFLIRTVESIEFFECCICTKNQINRKLITK